MNKAPNSALVFAPLSPHPIPSQQLQRQHLTPSHQPPFPTGTHALLGKDVKFKDLGLLVVDEEQRFGVRQKERMKILSNGVDVLTLSATPIPRTLQMSLSGIRDTSTIRTPPPMRLPIKTELIIYDTEKIAEAIKKELARGGQCYYVVPRISLIEAELANLHRHLPDLRVLVAHGRLGRGLAEANVAAFAEGKADVLLATTVIENGLDIPSVNTIIVVNANNFGMSSLYQLRGRVGRSNKQAYAYLCYPKDSMVSFDAQRRLSAMEDLTSLGSGFDIANRDLEIRGAGSIFGVEQSGVAGKVGYDLYMRMLRKAIKKMKGLSVTPVARTQTFLPNNEGDIDAGKNRFSLPADYIPDDKTREDEEWAARLAETSSRLVEVTKSWQERFGDLPEGVKVAAKNLHLHACTRILGIDEIHLDDNTGDAILRAPGLRPRHWREIRAELKATGVKIGKSLEAVFPVNTMAEEGEDEVEEEDGWDELDEEETRDTDGEAIEEGSWENAAAFVVRDVGKLEEGKRADRILKLLLPIANAVAKRKALDEAASLKETEMREKKLKEEREALGPRKNRKGLYILDPKEGLENTGSFS
jgi:hypothetical protein